eukprot:Rhum_TRINITY_DN14319_c14_g1::Rhum_TRINITY_DN14319_c14_g1_i1::g.81757::m.81757
MVVKFDNLGVPFACLHQLHRGQCAVRVSPRRVVRRDVDLHDTHAAAPLEPLRHQLDDLPHLRTQLAALGRVVEDKDVLRLVQHLLRERRAHHRREPRHCAGARVRVRPHVGAELLAEVALRKRGQRLRRERLRCVGAFEGELVAVVQREGRQVVRRQAVAAHEHVLPAPVDPPEADLVPQRRSRRTRGVLRVRCGSLVRRVEEQPADGQPAGVVLRDVLRSDVVEQGEAVCLQVLDHPVEVQATLHHVLLLVELLVHREPRRRDAFGRGQLGGVDGGEDEVVAVVARDLLIEDSVGVGGGGEEAAGKDHVVVLEHLQLVVVLEGRHTAARELLDELLEVRHLTAVLVVHLLAMHPRLDGGVRLDIVLPRKLHLSRCINLDKECFTLQLRRSLLPHRLQLLAVAAPRRVELDHHHIDVPVVMHKRVEVVTVADHNVGGVRAHHGSCRGYHQRREARHVVSVRPNEVQIL